MAKKVFYNRRYKMPAWGQLYAVWAVVAVVACGIVYFTSVEKISGEPAPALSLGANGFSEGLYYDLREAEDDGLKETITAYAKRLEKKYGYQLKSESAGTCTHLRLTRGEAPRYGFTATAEGKVRQNVYALMTFLDAAARQGIAAPVEADILIAEKKCGNYQLIQKAAPGSRLFMSHLYVGTPEADYDAVPLLKNLNLRRHFEPAFLTKERTLWTNLLALVANNCSSSIDLPLPANWGDGPEALLAQNPLAKHPLVAKNIPVQKLPPVALYLGTNTQLHRVGFYVLIGLFWLLAAIPLANAMGAFRERLDLGSAATSSILYGLAFFAYFLVLKFLLNHLRSDIAVVLLTLLLLIGIFIPVRILQKSVLRAELNRAGLHVIVQLLLTVVIFLNPLLAFIGFACLMIASAFSRAAPGRKVLRFFLILILFAGFFLATRQILGNFTNFFATLLPGFNGMGIVSMVLMALICGNLVSLFFVPRERV